MYNNGNVAEETECYFQQANIKKPGELCVQKATS